ncbi:hypothetical protein M408DRAFT_328850 [Serendipita vermifera MAFF 305830]|uniref:Uncharacterized protein n=1 Tax=Serendipita vermifera MAFF 305830 TaxID=933852 RepID=A0A0C2XKW0_SERVB|nr:hypothetical protein M408DRAFT_328850 [Serendipita vermifera MAFF 305830]
MSLPNDFEDSPTWGSVSQGAPADILRDAMRKEAIIKEVVSGQEDLRALLGRVQSVQDEVDKLLSGNEMLQVYIENLSKQIARG